MREGREEPRWFWSIQGVLGKPADMRDHGDALTLESAKAELEANWRKWLAWAKLGETD